MFEIRVPATSANLGPGFDCLGFAIQIYNKFKIEKTKTGFETEIFDIYSGKKLYLNIEENLFYHALNKVCDYTGKSLDGIKLTEEVNIPFARGLGSSASAVVAGLLAGNFLLGDIVSEGDLINLAVEMEGHPDNVLPAFKGGFIINVIDDQKLVYKRIDINSDINFVIAIPDFKLKTEDVRKVLPDKVSYRDAVFNLSRTAMLVACLQDNDFGKLKVAMQDKLHQDFRSDLIPGFYQVIDAAYQEGAYGVALSGAGPSLMAITGDNSREIGERMVDTFNKYNIKCKYIITSPDNSGYIINK